MFRLVAVPPSLFSRPLHRTCMVAARKSFTPRSNVAHRSRNVRHQNGPFSALHAPSLSVAAPSLHDMHIFDVNKCTYLYGQLPSPALLEHPRTSSMWLNVAHANALGRCRWPLPVGCQSSDSIDVARDCSGNQMRPAAGDIHLLLRKTAHVARDEFDSPF